MKHIYKRKAYALFSPRDVFFDLHVCQKMNFSLLLKEVKGQRWLRLDLFLWAS